MARQKKYKRLGRGSNLMQAIHLYDAHDHLLMVTGSFTEEYRRFYYRDIQAALIRRQRGKMIVVVLFLLLGIAGIGASLSAGDDFLALAIFLAFPTLILVLWALPRMLTGGFCTFYLQTNVQNMPIPAVTSTGKARKIIKLIRERTAEQEREMPPPPEPQAYGLPPVLPRT